MILVTLGTQKHSFKRLLKMVEMIDTDEKIIIQAGYTKYENDKIKIFDFMSYEELEKLTEEADIVITHGGTGSIILPLEKQKKTIVCARLRKYNEHINDHQLEIVDSFAKNNLIIELKENSDLNAIIKNIDKYHLNKFKSNKDNFIDKLEKTIKEI